MERPVLLSRSSFPDDVLMMIAPPILRNSLLLLCVCGNPLIPAMHLFVQCLSSVARNSVLIERSNHDELLINKPLRQYFMIIDYALPWSERLFMSHFDHGYIASVLEVICAHFLVLLSDEQTFENLLNRLFWCSEEDFRTPEVTLPAALSLLLNPIILSAPKMFQAYMVLLVSEGIDICMPCENIVPDPQLMGSYSAAFERSVFLY